MPNGVQVKDGFEIMMYGPDPQPALGGKPLGLRVWTSNANATGRYDSAFMQKRNSIRPSDGPNR